MIFLHMTSLSLNDVHGPQTREIATPAGLPLNSPGPANIADLRLPVSV